VGRDDHAVGGTGSDVDLFTDEALAEPCEPYEIYREPRDLGSVVYLTAHDVYAIPRHEAPGRSAGPRRGSPQPRRHAERGIEPGQQRPAHLQRSARTPFMRNVFQRPLRGDRLAALRPQLEHEARTSAPPILK
jgi:hypothetical protein